MVVALSPRGAWVVFGVLAAVLPIAAYADDIPQVPCSDPRGCPDLVVDGVLFAVGTQGEESFPENSCAVQEGMIEPGNRQVIRFTFATPNVGAGDLKIGRPADHPEWFVFHPCHNHFHFREYADYRVWTVEGWLAWDEHRKAEPNKTAQEVLNDHPELLSEFVAGNKAGFCVIDVIPGLPTALAMAVPPDALPKYLGCISNQGISRGWADMYHWELDGQWVDVTDVAPGPYVLESEVNAERLYVESDYANNRAVLPVVVT